MRNNTEPKLKDLDLKYLHLHANKCRAMTKAVTIIRIKEPTWGRAKVGLISTVKGITWHKNQHAIFMYLFVYHDTQMVLDGYPLGITVKNNLGISKSDTPTFVVDQRVHEVICD